ncbi:MAG TPA: FtsX-like permease family protein, partial [Chitinophagaceae bacterium]
YRTEIQLKQASYVATILSFIIVFLGILGLIALSVQRRTKEIGIRKVLGSSVNNIIALFVKDLMKTILVSGLIACPIAWLILDKWLSDYSTRIALTPLPFIIAIGMLVLLTAVLVVMQTIKIALRNPVQSLRTE